MLEMHPMSFEEFLEAVGDHRSVEYLQSVTRETKISDLVHHHLWTQLKYYFVVGGCQKL